VIIYLSERYQYCYWRTEQSFIYEIERRGFFETKT